MDESKLGENGCVKVQFFPGAIIDARLDQAIATKKPLKVILHVATNDTIQCSADVILQKPLDLKDGIEKELNGCNVISSLPIRRNDKIKATKTIQTLNTKNLGFGLSIVDTSNISNSHIGHRELYLNEKGVTKLASNIINKLRSL